MDTTLKCCGVKQEQRNGTVTGGSMGPHFCFYEGWRNYSMFVDGIEFSREERLDDTGEGRNFWSDVFEWGECDGI